MWRRIPSIQSASVIGVAVLNIISWIPPIQDWFSKTFPTTDIRWVNLVFILIFILVMYWVLHELYKRLEESENEKPSISVIPTLVEDVWYLDVTNNGETGVFSATVIFVPKLPSTVEEQYEALWRKTMTDETKLMNGKSDQIKIASIKYTHDMQYFVMNAYDNVKRTPNLVRRIEYKQFINTVDMNIQVIISSSPKLKDGKPFIRTYSIGSHYIVESKRQLKKLDSIPHQWGLGDDDIDVSN